MKTNQRLKAAILAVVDNQLAANDPPETTQTLERLTADGYSDQEAKELIGNIVVRELFEVYQAGKAFDLERYVAALKRLPKLPGLPTKGKAR